MAWIQTVRRDDAEGELKEMMGKQREMYPPEYFASTAEQVGTEESIVESHALIPEALYHAFATFGALMRPDLPLNRREHEIIATMVSAANNCFYCTESHAEFLRRVTLDDDMVAAMRADYKTAPLSDAEKVMVEYVVQLTKESYKITEKNHVRLREAGFDDQAILQMTLIAAWFNYINRIANSLGVGQTGY